MSTKRGQLCIGTSGYQYDHWKGVFYPRDLPKKSWFEYYVTRCSSFLLLTRGSGEW